MKNKIELKKTLKIVFLFILILISLFEVVNLFEYRKYTHEYNQKIESVISNVIEKYPNADEDELVEILSDYSKESSNILEKYGIDLKKDSAILKNQKYFAYFNVAQLIVILVLSTGIIVIFIMYNYNKNKKLDEITSYIEKINNGNYRLDIDDNTEDELSILKNEVYKTTVMLREIAQNSQKDKANLKDALSDISHQLKTPLTSMNIMIDNILDDPNMDKNMRTEFLKDIKKEVFNISFLVNSLLKLSKLDADSVQFINKLENIEDILKKSVENVAAICDLKNIKIEVYGKENCNINCDLRWQVEAITNILKNCAEHSPIGSSIEISYLKNKLYTQINIQDHGIGIDKEDLPHIFERFYKGKNSLEDSVGIGLALSKSIIEKDNGYVNVESQVGRGTKFTIKYYNDFS